MKPLVKNLLAFIIFLMAVFIAVDMIPAELKGTMGTVIHKTIIPVDPEMQGMEEPKYVVVLWAENEYRAINLSTTPESWNNYRIGDKIMIYSRDGWITNFPYKVDIQGNLSQL